MSSTGLAMLVGFFKDVAEKILALLTKFAKLGSSVPRQNCLMSCGKAERKGVAKASPNWPASCPLAKIA